MKVGKLGWLVAMFLSGGMAVAQGTVDDYRRAYALKEKMCIRDRYICIGGLGEFIKVSVAGPENWLPI